MRMWMVSPKTMCRKHLLGEHVECHMLLGSLKRNKKLGKLEEFVEPRMLQKRHDALAKEMLRRGYKHKSPLVIPPTVFLPSCKVNRKDSARELYSRCGECNARKNRIRTTQTAA